MTEQETQNMQKDMSAILDYFALLKKAKTTKSATTKKKGRKIEEVTRKDKAEPRSASLANNLIGMAPDKKDDYIKVKSIL